MMRDSRCRWARSGAVTGLMLAAIGLLSAAEARAGCGHPWVRPATLPDTVSGLRILDDLANSDPSHRGAPGEPGHPSPCARGACSPAPAIPPTSAERIPHELKLWGVSPSLGRLALCLADEDLSDFPCGRPSHWQSPLERPPR